MKVDYVVTYLDPTDQCWLEQFSQYSKVEMKKQPERYDTDGTRHLKYQFRGLDRYMPWINNVYLVVFSESQVPDWVNRETVKVITDDMYIPKKYLPTFNTATKQMHLQFIPGLEECWIQADDDYFTINPVDQATYFEEDGTPKGEWTKKFLMKKPGLSDEDWTWTYYNSARMAQVITNHEVSDDFYTYEFWHTPAPFRKSVLSNWYGQIDDMDGWITPCRDRHNLIGVMWTIANSNIARQGIQMNHVEIQWDSTEDIKNMNIMDFHNKNVQVLNINYNHHKNDSDFYVRSFEQLFPDKCKYEL